MSEDNILLVPYDPHWAELARSEALMLRNLWPNMSLEIEHIGSTAIPGVAAKPIIDLLVGIESESVAEQIIESLEQMNYSYWRDNPNRWHFFFVITFECTQKRLRTMRN